MKRVLVICDNYMDTKNWNGSVIHTKCQITDSVYHRFGCSCGLRCCYVESDPKRKHVIIKNDDIEIIIAHSQMQPVSFNTLDKIFNISKVGDHTIKEVKKYVHGVLIC